MGSRQSRRELYANTLAASGWAQATLVASVLSLPLLTRFLSKPEFGLWTQMLSLTGLATLADLGMAQVFLRRMASGTSSSRGAVLRVATAFYGISGAILAAALLGICLVPGGLVTPFVGRTRLPEVTAVAIILAIAVNLGVQSYGLRILARGRMDLERIFGAGPAVVGTLVSVGAAYWFGSAFAVGLAYALVEVGFDAALVVVVRRSPAFRFERAIGERLPPVGWLSLVKESWGVLVIGLVPQLTLVIDAAVVGRIEGPAAIAIYAVSFKVADLVRRVFSPFTESLFVSLCRATETGRAAVVSVAATLPWLVLTSGLAVGCAIVAVGGHALTLVFGAGYERGEAALMVLLVAATLRTMYMPAVRRLQAEAFLGSLPRWFVVGIVAHTVLAVALTTRWSILGTAVSVLIVVLTFEAGPVAWAVRQHTPGSTHLRAIANMQVGSGIAGGTVVLLLTWSRLTLSGWSAAVSGGLAVALGGIALGQLFRYLRSSRLVVAGA